MFRAVTIVALALLSTPAIAGQNATAEKPQPPAAAKPVAAEVIVPTANVKIEVSITDQTGSAPPARKVVSMIAGDRQSTYVRSSASVPVKAPGNVGVMNFNYRNVTINVDARPTIVAKDSNKVLVSLGLEYLPRSAGGQEEMEAGMASLSERLALLLESGKPMIISQAADPTSDRKITVEVTATILK